MKKSEYLSKNAPEAIRKSANQFNTERCSNNLEGALINLREDVFKAKSEYDNELVLIASGDSAAIQRASTAKVKLEVAERALRIIEDIRKELDTEVDEFGEALTGTKK